MNLRPIQESRDVEADDTRTVLDIEIDAFPPEHSGGLVVDLTFEITFKRNPARPSAS